MWARPLVTCEPEGCELSAEDWSMAAKMSISGAVATGAAAILAGAALVATHSSRPFLHAKLVCRVTLPEQRIYRLSPDTALLEAPGASSLSPGPYWLVRNATACEVRVSVEAPDRELIDLYPLALLSTNPATLLVAGDGEFYADQIDDGVLTLSEDTRISLSLPEDQSTPSAPISERRAFAAAPLSDGRYLGILFGFDETTVFAAYKRQDGRRYTLVEWARVPFGHWVWPVDRDKPAWMVLGKDGRLSVFRAEIGSELTLHLGEAVWHASYDRSSSRLAWLNARGELRLAVVSDTVVRRMLVPRLRGIALLLGAGRLALVNSTGAITAYQLPDFSTMWTHQLQVSAPTLVTPITWSAETRVVLVERGKRATRVTILPDDEEIGLSLPIGRGVAAFSITPSPFDRDAVLLGLQQYGYVLWSPNSNLLRTTPYMSLLGTYPTFYLGRERLCFMDPARGSWEECAPTVVSRPLALSPGLRRALLEWKEPMHSGQNSVQKQFLLAWDIPTWRVLDCVQVRWYRLRDAKRARAGSNYDCCWLDDQKLAYMDVRVPASSPRARQLEGTLRLFSFDDKRLVDIQECGKFRVAEPSGPSRLLARVDSRTLAVATLTGLFTVTVDGGKHRVRLVETGAFTGVYAPAAGNSLLAVGPTRDGGERVVLLHAEDKGGPNGRWEINVRPGYFSTAGWTQNGRYVAIGTSREVRLYHVRLER